MYCDVLILHVLVSRVDFIAFHITLLILIKRHWIISSITLRVNVSGLLFLAYVSQFVQWDSKLVSFYSFSEIALQLFARTKGVITANSSFIV